MRHLIWFWQAASNGEPLTPVTCHSVVTAAGSLSLTLSLSLWGDSNNHWTKQNHCAKKFSLSICHSLSLFLFLSEVILTATEQQIPVYKHWVPAQFLLLSLCVTVDCQEFSVTVCYRSEHKSQSPGIPQHHNKLNNRQRSQYLSPTQQELPKMLNFNFQKCWSFCPQNH